jgi:hypothetical protein
MHIKASFGKPHFLHVYTLNSLTIEVSLHDFNFFFSVHFFSPYLAAATGSGSGRSVDRVLGCQALIPFLIKVPHCIGRAVSKTSHAFLQVLTKQGAPFVTVTRQEWLPNHRRALILKSHLLPNLACAKSLVGNRVCGHPLIFRIHH